MIAKGRAERGISWVGLVALALLVALWAGPAAAQYGGGGGGASPGGAPHGEPTGPSAPTASTKKVPLNPYEQALQFKQQGNYQKAIDLLEPLAKYGHTYEVAQYNLGQCYIAVSESKPDPAEAQQARVTGVSWIIKAANAGLAPAQQELVRLTLQGGKFKVEPAEAGKWYLLWKRNPTRTQLGVVELDPALQRSLNTTLTDADWAEANRRADSWQISVEPGQGPAP
ncbi:MAG: hypothetical protein WCC64_20380 [Aliidongia sp.]